MASEFDDKRRTRLHGIDAFSNPSSRNSLADLLKNLPSSPTSPYSGLLNALSPPSSPGGTNTLRGLFASLHRS